MKQKLNLIILLLVSSALGPANVLAQEQEKESMSPAATVNNDR